MPGASLKEAVGEASREKTTKTSTKNWPLVSLRITNRIAFILVVGESKVSVIVIYSFTRNIIESPLLCRAIF